MATLILASASPARLELLKRIGMEPDIVAPADVDETPLKQEKPRDYVLRVAKSKAHTIAKQHPDAYIIAADTVATLSRKIIGKAANEAEARAIIRSFSGRRHNVLSGLCILGPNGKESSRLVKTVVKFCNLTDPEIDAYIATGQWEGKSGCFGIQGYGGGFIEWINGSFTNVIGLPLTETRNILKGMGYTSCSKS